MANKRKYASKGEYEKAMQAKRNEWNARAYKKLTVALPKDLAERLEERIRLVGGSKRQYIINLLEKEL